MDFSRVRRLGRVTAVTIVVCCCYVAMPQRTVRALKDTAFLQQTLTTSVVQAPRLPENASWMCRLSREDEGCDSREYQDPYGNRYQWATCPPNQCCTSTKCARLGQCGRWCASGFFFCGTSLTYYSYYSYGGECKCNKYQSSCSPNGKCVEHIQSDGGVYCQCNDGYLGDGKDCVKDMSCNAGGRKGHENCYPGRCDDGASFREPYKCECPTGYISESGPEGESCQKGPCLSIGKSRCGDGECVTVPVDGRGYSYSCICPKGYLLKTTEEEGHRCVKGGCLRGGTDSCGPNGTCRDLPEEGEDAYTCDCAKGYIYKEDEQRCVEGGCMRHGREACGSGECTDIPQAGEDGYTCDCADGYFFDASKKRCVEGGCLRRGNEACGRGTCTDAPEKGEDGYVCECAKGYFLRESENRCVKGACMLYGRESCGEDGRCIDLPEKGEDGYTCECPPEKTVLDEVSQPERPFCSHDQCLLHGGKGAKACEPGSCISDKDRQTYSCSCPKHLTNDKNNPDGDRCVEPPDFCYGSCQGDSTCEGGEAVGEGKCVCPPGKAPVVDEEASVTTCKDDPCAGTDCGGGRCIPYESESGYRCLCSPGFMKTFAGGKEKCREARY